MKNNKGFGLTEMIVVGGMLGVFSMATMKLMQKQGSFVKKMSADVELLDVHGYLGSTIRSNDGCKKTLEQETIPPIGGTVSIDSIINKRDLVIFEVGETYNDKIRIAALEIRNVDVPPSGLGRITLGVGYEKIGNNMSGAKFITKTIDLYGSVDAGNILQNCHSKEGEAISLICDQIAGSFDAHSGVCTPPWQTGAPFNIRGNLSVNGSISGGSISGSSITASGTIRGSQFCTSNGCRDFSPANCTGDQFVQAVAADGSVTCVKPTTVTGSCSGDQFLKSINADGSVNCAKPSTASGSCSGNQFVKSISASGSVSCGTPASSGGGSGSGGGGSCTMVTQNLDRGEPRCPSGYSKTSEFSRSQSGADDDTDTIKTIQCCN